MRYSDDSSCYNALLKLQEQASEKLKTLKYNTQVYWAWHVIVTKVTTALVAIERKNMLEHKPEYTGGQSVLGKVVAAMKRNSENPKVRKIRRAVYEKWVKVAEESHYIEYTDPEAKRAWED